MREARLTNISLLGKLVWALEHHKDKFWVQVVATRYLKDNYLLGAQSGYRSSYVWRSIVKALNSLKEGFTFNLGSGNLSLWFDTWHKDGPICTMVDYVHVSNSHLTLRDLWWDDVWHFDMLCTTLPVNIQEFISNQCLTSFANCEACWIWTGMESGIYSAASAYRWLTSSLHGAERVDSWSWVWKLAGPEKYHLFVWLILHEALPTNSLRYKRHLLDSATCNRCQIAGEDMVHCLRDCGSAKSLWLELGFGADTEFFMDDLHSWLHRHLKDKSDLLFLTSLWWIWRWRNQSLFGDHNWPMHYVLHEVWSSHSLMMRVFMRLERELQMPKQVRWVKPRIGEVKLNTDGSRAGILQWLGLVIFFMII